jgi:ribosomal protein L29
MTVKEYNRRLAELKEKYFNGEVSLDYHFLELDALEKEMKQFDQPQ